MVVLTLKTEQTIPKLICSMFLQFIIHSLRQIVPKGKKQSYKSMPTNI